MGSGSVKHLAQAAGLCLLLGAAPAGAISLFQVGNSFTQDSKPEGLAAMFEYALGEPAVTGFHLRGNQTLDTLWNEPDAAGTMLTDFGPHTVALPENSWDYLTLQTFPALSNPTLGEEVARIQDFVAAADIGSGGQTEIIVYGPWAGRGDRSWSRWDDAVVDSPDQLTLHIEAYHDLLYDKVEELYPGRVRLASAGKVLREVIDRMQAGEGPISGWRDLYRDPIHLSEVGRFVAATTVFTTITRLNPIGMPVPREVTDWDEAEFSDEVALELQEIVWEVVTADRRSGVSPVGDLNVDTVVDEIDAQAWVNAYGAQTAVTIDPNGDGIVDAADVAIWVDGQDVGVGDINLDGQANAIDLAVWGDDFGRAGLLASDVNKDGVVDTADYTLIRDQVSEAQRVDFNADGVTDQADLDTLMAQFGWSTDLRTDANGDGRVDAADYTVWRDAVATAGLSSISTPEPTTGATALVGLLAAFRRRV